MYTLHKKSEKSLARRAAVELEHGTVQTPFFMTIATKAAVKTMSTSDIAALSPQILLSNTYHLMLRPGMDIMQQAAGLHNFMNWHGPILTDSGGYQVFSLSGLRKLTEEGVKFQSHLDGSYHMLTPERAVQIQQTIGSDIMMCLDECAPYPCDYDYAKKSLEMTTRWAARCKEFKDSNDEYKANPNQKLFGIVQGSVYKDLRLMSAEQLTALDFDGYAIGGLAVGEPRESMYEVLEGVVPTLPEDKPRYLMGVGYPEEIVQAVKFGVDMFDCVIPTREGRHGRLFMFDHSIDDVQHPDFYAKINLKRAEFATNFEPMNPHSSIPELREYTWAYLHHLFKTNEMLGQRLASMNNVEFYLTLMKRIRQQIEDGTL
jgi:queuine tRNA-ribosyltransferase